jgi:hypothetical protein
MYAGEYDVGGLRNVMEITPKLLILPSCTLHHQVLSRSHKLRQLIRLISLCDPHLADADALPFAP